MPTMEPIPKNLREQMLERVTAMPDADVVALHEMWLLREKMRVREEMSAQAEREQADGVWADLPKFIREYRALKKTA